MSPDNSSAATALRGDILTARDALRRVQTGRIWFEPYSNCLNPIIAAIKALDTLAGYDNTSTALASRSAEGGEHMEAGTVKADSDVGRLLQQLAQHIQTYAWNREGIRLVAEVNRVLGSVVAEVSQWQVESLKATLRIVQLGSDDDTNPSWDDFEQALATVDTLVEGWSRV